MAKPAACARQARLRIVAAVCAFASTAMANVPSPAADPGWPAYGNDPGGTRYSTAASITGEPGRGLWDRTIDQPGGRFIASAATLGIVLSTVVGAGVRGWRRKRKGRAPISEDLPAGQRVESSTVQDPFKR